MKIFISCVTAQFKECREAIASDLRAKGCQVAVQEDFRQGPRTLVELLEEYIAHCDCVIALVGDAYGFKVPDTGLPTTDWPRSYTQWEYFLACGERLDGCSAQPKDLYVYFASKKFLRSHSVQQQPEQSDLQRRFCDQIFSSGKNYSEFENQDALCARVLRDLPAFTQDAQVSPELVVGRILDVQKQKDDLWNAITLYCSRLPEVERYDPGEFQELIKHHIEGDFGPHRPSQFWKAYCLVAKVANEVAGMLLAYEDTKAEFFFISYIVARKPHLGKFNEPDISRRLLKQLLMIIGGLKPPGRRLRLLAEVDHPANASNEKGRTKSIARIKLFEQVAANLGVELRCLDLPYVQPQLDPLKPEIQMVLIYMTEHPPICLPRSEVIELLTWTYTGLYSPDIFNDPTESEKYGTYLNKLLSKTISQLPDNVKLLRARQL